jgi:RNA polymerase sigma-70 factor (ECF subfamily)
VNEAYLRLLDIRHMRFQDRAHFFAVGARIMRRVLVDHARARGYVKRGGDAQRVEFDEALMVAQDLDPDLARLDDALQTLEQFDARKARVVEMRYFGGLTASEMAVVLGVSEQTVHLDWSLAKAWLARELSRKEPDGSAALGGN